jgi:hypothetical protein
MSIRNIEVQDTSEQIIMIGRNANMNRSASVNVPLKVIQ